MKRTPSGFFDMKKNRVAAVRWLVERTGKDPQELEQRDFTSNRLGGLISHRYGNSPYAAVTEAFPRLHLKAWEMKITPRGFFDTKKNRVAATRWLAAVVGRTPTEADFCSKGLSGLILRHYQRSTDAALREAGLLTE